jgi:hypothetical protein
MHATGLDAIASYLLHPMRSEPFNGVAAVRLCPVKGQVSGGETPSQKSVSNQATRGS